MAVFFSGQTFFWSYLRLGWLMWHKNEAHLMDAGPTVWPWHLTSSMTLTFNFQGQILKLLYLRNARADWHGMKGMWVDRMLDPLCDLDFQPLPWHWPWIFSVKFWNSHITGLQGPIDKHFKNFPLIYMQWISKELNTVYGHYNTMSFLWNTWK